jgi:hypothetical protein
MNESTLFDTVLFPAPGDPELEVRGDDHAMTSCLSIFDVRRNDGKIYAALVRMAEENGRSADDGTWAVRVGYTALRKASGCSTRALGRAWPRLLELGFLKSIEPHKDRRAARYVGRSIACVDSTYKDAGYMYFRVLPDGKILPFRPKPQARQETR